MSPYGAPQRYFSTHFGLPTSPKSTLRVLLVPLFGQSQKENSANFALTEFYEVGSEVRLVAGA